MTQPEGFVVVGQESKVCHLKKAFYGLRQAPCAQFSKINEYLKEQGLHLSSANYNLYYCFEDGQAVVLLLHVNDLLVIGNNTNKINWIKKQLMQHFEMTNLGEMNYYLKVRFIYL